MANARDELAATRAALQRSKAQSDDPVVPASKSARTEPFRLSVHIPPNRYYDLQKWLADAQRHHGRSIEAMSMWNVLLKLLLTDAKFGERVLNDPDLLSERRARKRK